MRKIIYCLLAAVVFMGFAAVISTNSAKADSAQIKINASASNVEKEEILSVIVNVDSQIQMGKFNCTIDYDETLLEYISDDDQAVAGASGVVNILEEFDIASNGKSYELKFKALDIGTTTIELHDSMIEEYTSTKVIPLADTSIDINIKINNKESDEARLSDVMIAQIDLGEAFNPDIYEYQGIANEDVEQLLMSVSAIDENAVINVEKPEKLEMGMNKVVIKVTAVSGVSKEYTIMITKQKTVDQMSIIEETDEEIMAEESEIMEETEMNIEVEE